MEASVSTPERARLVFTSKIQLFSVDRAKVHTMRIATGDNHPLAQRIRACGNFITAIKVLGCPDKSESWEDFSARNNNFRHIEGQVTQDWFRFACYRNRHGVAAFDVYEKTDGSLEIHIVEADEED